MHLNNFMNASLLVIIKFIKKSFKTFQDHPNLFPLEQWRSKQSRLRSRLPRAHPNPAQIWRLFVHSQCGDRWSSADSRQSLLWTECIVTHHHEYTARSLHGVVQLGSGLCASRGDWIPDAIRDCLNMSSVESFVNFFAAREKWNLHGNESNVNVRRESNKVPNPKSNSIAFFYCPVRVRHQTTKKRQ